MFYKYTIKFRNGNELNGYAESDKTASEIQKGIAKKFFGDFYVEIEKFGKKFPPVNSDYIITI